MVTISFYHPLDLEKVYRQLVKKFEMKGVFWYPRNPPKTAPDPNNGGNWHHQSRVPAIASLTLPIHAPTLKKPSPWHQFTHLLNK